MFHPINWSLALPYYAAALAFGYLLGSIPFGLLLTRIAGTQDLRSIGSGNIGATNVLRTGRKGLGPRHASVRHAQGHGRRADHVLVVGPRCVASSPGSARSSATCFRSGSASKAARASPPISASCSASPGPPRSLLRPSGLAIAAVTRYSSLAALVAAAATPFVLWFAGVRQEAQVLPRPDGADLHHAPRQHRAPDPGPRGQDRREGKLSRLIAPGSPSARVRIAKHSPSASCSGRGVTCGGRQS